MSSCCGDKYQVPHRLLAKKISGTFLYERVGYDQREIVLSPEGKVSTPQGGPAGGLERQWRYSEDGILFIGADGVDNIRLIQDGKIWKGAWLRYEKMDVILTPKQNNDNLILG